MYIGIDLGGTNIAAGIVDKEGKIIFKDSVPTKAERSAEEVIHDMAELAKKLVEKAGVSMDDIEWIGIGSPGSVNPKTGVIEYANNLNFRNVEMRKILQTYIDKPVYMGNDANVAALGEAYAGAAKGVDHAVMITLGTGLGGGIIIDKKIYCGFNFYGAELGHLVIEYNGRQCTCGRKGCWEAYSSATGLVNMTKEKMLEEKNSLMWEICGGDIERASGRTAFNAMKKGDKAAAQVVDMYISYLACGIASVINVFQPEVLCIGGGVSNEGDNLLKPLIEKVNKETYTKDGANSTKIKVATLGNDAGIVGAAMLGVGE